MSDVPDIRVTPVNASLRPAVLRLAVLPEQRAYVGDVAVLLIDADQCSGSEAMAVLLDDGPIGFYRLEVSAGSVTTHVFMQPTLGLRAFFIDRRWQGRGLGRAALLAALVDIANRHPAARALALSVDRDNLAALALYRHSGFEHVARLYHIEPPDAPLLLLRELPLRTD